VTSRATERDRKDGKKYKGKTVEHRRQEDFTFLRKRIGNQLLSKY